MGHEPGKKIKRTGSSSPEFETLQHEYSIEKSIKLNLFLVKFYTNLTESYNLLYSSNDGPRASTTSCFFEFYTFNFSYNLPNVNS